MKIHYYKLIPLIFVMSASLGWGQEYGNDMVGSACMVAPISGEAGGVNIRTALQQGDESAVAQYFYAGGDMNIHNSGGDTLLMEAVKARNVDAVRALLYYSDYNFPKHPNAVQVDAVNGNKQTALHMAAKLDKVEGVVQLMLHLLLEANANPDAVDSLGMTPLAYAQQANQSYTQRILLQEGADPEARLIDGGLNAYEYAEVTFNNHARRELAKWRDRSFVQRGSDAFAHFLYESFEAIPGVGHFADRLVYGTGIKSHFDDTVSSVVYYGSVPAAALTSTVTTAAVGITTYLLVKYAQRGPVLPFHQRVN